MTFRDMIVCGMIHCVALAEVCSLRMIVFNEIRLPVPLQSVGTFIKFGVDMELIIPYKVYL